MTTRRQRQRRSKRCATPNDDAHTQTMLAGLKDVIAQCVRDISREGLRPEEWVLIAQADGASLVERHNVHEPPLRAPVPGKLLVLIDCDCGGMPERHTVSFEVEGVWS